MIQTGLSEIKLSHPFEK